MDIKAKIKENLISINENDIKQQFAKSLGLTHSSHNVWHNNSNKLFRWNGYQFIPIDNKEVGMNTSMDKVLLAYPNAEILQQRSGSDVKYHVTYPKESRGKAKNMSIGKGNTPEEAWEQARIYIDEFRVEKPAKQEDLNKDLIDQIQKKKEERNWDSLGNIQKSQVEKFAEKIFFDSNDVGTRIKIKNAATWNDLIDIVKKSNYKLTFRL